jgi:Calcineurin-like phosphoesterase
MIKQVNKRAEISRYVETLRDSLGHPELRDAVDRAAGAIEGEGDPATKLRAAIPSGDAARASSGGDVAKEVPFLARDPIVSLFQSSLDMKLREARISDDTFRRRSLWSEMVHAARRLLHPRRYGPTDSEWVIDVGEAMLKRLAMGNHPFNREPAEHEISASARLIVVGDWGTGLPRARDVATVMAEEVVDALKSGRQAHVVHLGDVYYSGLPEECESHVLAPGMWPVTAEQANGGVTSWSLNGNHDMYGGGHGYFEHLLTNERFRNQRSSDGDATSFFRLSSPHWDFLALDTSWDSNVLAQGHSGVLKEPQADRVKQWAAESDRKLVLLSHHQPVSVYDEGDVDPPALYNKLATVLDEGRVTAWLWGHEHRCMGFAESLGVRFPRCIGHGGVPVLIDTGDFPRPGLWEERGFTEEGGDRWARFGCVILDIHDDRIDVRYRDDRGTTTREEAFA